MLENIVAMTPRHRLLIIKSIHTAIWLFFVSVIGYVLYAGFSGAIDEKVWLAIALVTLEGIVIVSNRGKCPLTAVAARSTEDRRDNFDIFLPVWLAKYNKEIFTPVFFFGVLVVLYRIIASSSPQD